MESRLESRWEDRAQFDRLIDPFCYGPRLGQHASNDSCRTNHKHVNVYVTSGSHESLRAKNCTQDSWVSNQRWEKWMLGPCRTNRAAETVQIAEGFLVLRWKTCAYSIHDSWMIRGNKFVGQEAQMRNMYPSSVPAQLTSEERGHVWFVQGKFQMAGDVRAICHAARIRLGQETFDFRRTNLSDGPYESRSTNDSSPGENPYEWFINDFCKRINTARMTGVHKYTCVWLISHTHIYEEHKLRVFIHAVRMTNGTRCMCASFVSHQWRASRMYPWTMPHESRMRKHAWTTNFSRTNCTINSIQNEVHV